MKLIVSSLHLLVVVAFLLLWTHNSCAKRRRGSSSGRRKTSSESESEVSDSEVTKAKIAAGANIDPAAYLVTRKRSYSSRSLPSSDDGFIYFSPSDLPDDFKVNNNQDWTPFLLVLEKETVYSCLIVPRTYTAAKCSSAFASHVTNRTEFLLPNQFENSLITWPESQSKPQIGICCGAGGFVPNVIIIIIGMGIVTFIFGNA